jgi:hypothetical protein
MHNGDVKYVAKIGRFAKGRELRAKKKKKKRIVAIRSLLDPAVNLSSTFWGRN